MWRESSSWFCLSKERWRALSQDQRVLQWDQRSVTLSQKIQNFALLWLLCKLPQNYSIIWKSLNRQFQTSWSLKEMKATISLACKSSSNDFTSALPRLVRSVESSRSQHSLFINQQMLWVILVKASANKAAVLQIGQQFLKKSKLQLARKVGLDAQLSLNNLHGDGVKFQNVKLKLPELSDQNLVVELRDSQLFVGIKNVHTTITSRLTVDFLVYSKTVEGPFSFFITEAIYQLTVDENIPFPQGRLSLTNFNLIDFNSQIKQIKTILKFGKQIIEKYVKKLFEEVISNINLAPILNKFVSQFIFNNQLLREIRFQSLAVAKKMLIVSFKSPYQQNLPSLGTTANSRLRVISKQLQRQIFLQIPKHKLENLQKFILKVVGAEGKIAITNRYLQISSFSQFIYKLQATFQTITARSDLTILFVFKNAVTQSILYNSATLTFKNQDINIRTFNFKNDLVQIKQNPALQLQNQKASLIGFSVQLTYRLNFISRLSQAKFNFADGLILDLIV